MYGNIIISPKCVNGQSSVYNTTAKPLCPRRPSLKNTTEIESYVSRTPTRPHPAAQKPLHQLALIAAALNPAEPAARAPAGPAECV